MDSAQAEALQKSLSGKVVGGWLIKENLGYGKSAVVMLAERDGIRAAVKVFHPELIELYGKDVQLARIRRETGLIGSRHENLVEILGGGECPDTGHLYVVMEEVPWKNLKSVRDSVPDNRIRQLISMVASAAEYLEEKGLAHRDIKPENIAVSDDLSRLKLLDLGVIRPVGVPGLTDVNMKPFIGTLRYSSPEFLLRQEEDSQEGWRALSIYQIGAVLHDLLMKKELFREYTEPFSLLVNAVKEVTPEIHGSDPDVVRICKYCLTKNPKTRLELVSWRDLINSDDEKDAATALISKIKARQQYAADLVAGNTRSASEEKRLLKQQLEEASTRLESKLTSLLTSLKCFPLRTIKSHVDVDCRVCTSRICFEENQEIGIPHQFSMFFELRLIDQNFGEPIYTLNGVAEMVVEGISRQLHLTFDIAAGSLTDVISDSHLEPWLLSTLSNTYDILDKG